MREVKENFFPSFGYDLFGYFWSSETDESFINGGKDLRFFRPCAIFRKFLFGQRGLPNLFENFSA